MGCFAFPASLAKRISEIARQGLSIERSRADHVKFVGLPQDRASNPGKNKSFIFARQRRQTPAKSPSWQKVGVFFPRFIETRAAFPRAPLMNGAHTSNSSGLIFHSRQARRCCQQGRSNGLNMWCCWLKGP